MYQLQESSELFWPHLSESPAQDCPTAQQGQSRPRAWRRDGMPWNANKEMLDMWPAKKWVSSMSGCNRGNPSDFSVVLSAPLKIHALRLGGQGRRSRLDLWREKGRKRKEGRCPFNTGNMKYMLSIHMRLDLKLWPCKNVPLTNFALWPSSGKATTPSVCGTGSDLALPTLPPLGSLDSSFGFFGSTGKHLGRMTISAQAAPLRGIKNDMSPVRISACLMLICDRSSRSIQTTFWLQLAFTKEDYPLHPPLLNRKCDVMWCV